MDVWISKCTLSDTWIQIWSINSIFLLLAQQFLSGFYYRHVCTWYCSPHCRRHRRWFCWVRWVSLLSQKSCKLQPSGEVKLQLDRAKGLPLFLQGLSGPLQATGRADTNTEVAKTNVGTTEEELNTAWVITRDEHNGRGSSLSFCITRRGNCIRNRPVCVRNHPLGLWDWESRSWWPSGQRKCHSLIPSISLI